MKFKICKEMRKLLIKISLDYYLEPQCINLNKPPKITNSTSTDVPVTGAWCNRMVVKH